MVHESDGLPKKDEQKKKAPLVEAIFELRWKLNDARPGFFIDPNYKILSGRLYDKLIKAYPYSDPLPAREIPEEMATGLVQFRYRKKKDEWPVVQLGPGIFSVNHAQNYNWNEFKKDIISAVEIFYSAHPQLKELFVNRLTVRYINAVNFDYSSNNIFEYLEKKMGTKIQLNTGLFEDSGLDQSPAGFNLGFSFKCTTPPSTVNLVFAKGKRLGKDALIWDTTVSSPVENSPLSIDDLTEWLESTHKITSRWFEKLTQKMEE